MNFGNVWKHFLVPRLGIEYYWHVGRGQGCCLTAWNAQDGSPPKGHSAPNVSNAETEIGLGLIVYFLVSLEW